MNRLPRFARRTLAGILAAAVFVAASPSGKAQTYTATPLGSLGGGTANATGINNSGTIVGYSTLTGGARTHAFKYSGSTMTDLGTLGGTDSNAFAVNAGQTVVGRADSNVGGSTLAFVDNGTMASLGTLGGSFSEANYINGAGTIVGDSLLADGVTSNGFSYSGGTMTNLGTLGGPTSYAYGINSYGTIVGRADFGSAATAHHGFSYSNGTMTDLGSLAGVSSNAYAINDSGTIVGYFSHHLRCHGVPCGHLCERCGHRPGIPGWGVQQQPRHGHKQLGQHRRFLHKLWQRRGRFPCCRRRDEGCHFAGDLGPAGRRHCRQAVNQRPRPDGRDRQR